jgi:Icc-related predicted phosphoesterase
MRLALISDTHGFCPEIPSDVDAVIHAGDIAADRGFVGNYTDEIYPWAASVGVPIYATFGNHDFAGQQARIPPGVPENLNFIVDQAHTINGVKFWFSPWSNLFGAWAYMLDEVGLAARYAKIPEDTEVIVSHGPPKNYGDKILWDGRIQNVGSVALAERAAQLPLLRYIITGHIHEAHGEYQMGHVTVLNVSHVDEMYRQRHAPTILELADGNQVTQAVASGDNRGSAAPEDTPNSVTISEAGALKSTLGGEVNG